MIESSDNTISYIVGASDTFAFPYRYLDAGYIECYLTDGETVRQLESGEFGVNAISGSVGANIVLAIDPLPAGQVLTIRRVVPLTQGLTLPNTGKLPTESLELQLDKIVMITQQFAEELARCVRAAVGSGVDPDALRDALLGAAATATASATAATSAKNAAAGSATAAATSATNAATSASSAANRALDAGTSATQAMEYGNSAADAKEDAEAAATAAATSATSAATSATAAAASASTAATQATAASGSATAAAGSAITAAAEADRAEAAADNPVVDVVPNAALTPFITASAVTYPEGGSIVTLALKAPTSPVSGTTYYLTYLNGVLAWRTT